MSAMYVSMYVSIYLCISLSSRLLSVFDKQIFILSHSRPRRIRAARSFTWRKQANKVD